jgi:hypothetical protein
LTATVGYDIELENEKGKNGEACAKKGKQRDGACKFNASNPPFGIWLRMAFEKRISRARAREQSRPFLSQDARIDNYYDNHSDN